MWDLSSWTRIRICIPCIGRWIFNHWTTSKVPQGLFITWLSATKCSLPAPSWSVALFLWRPSASPAILPSLQDPSGAFGSHEVFLDYLSPLVLQLSHLWSGENWTHFTRLWNVHELLVVKNSPANAGDKRPRFDPWVRKILCRRKWQPTPVFLPGKSHGQRRLVGYSPRCRKALNTTERSLTHIIRLSTAHSIQFSFLFPYSRPIVLNPAAY